MTAPCSCAGFADRQRRQRVGGSWGVDILTATWYNDSLRGALYCTGGVHSTAPPTLNRLFIQILTRKELIRNDIDEERKVHNNVNESMG